MEILGNTGAEEGAAEAGESRVNIKLASIEDDGCSDKRRKLSHGFKEPLISECC